MHCWDALLRPPPSHTELAGVTSSRRSAANAEQPSLSLTGQKWTCSGTLVAQARILVLPLADVAAELQSLQCHEIPQSAAKIDRDSSTHHCRGSPWPEDAPGGHAAPSWACCQRSARARHPLSDRAARRSLQRQICMVPGSCLKTKPDRGSSSITLDCDLRSGIQCWELQGSAGLLGADWHRALRC